MVLVQENFELKNFRKNLGSKYLQKRSRKKYVGQKKCLSKEALFWRQNVVQKNVGKID